MRQWGLKNYIDDRLVILKASLIYTWRVETAYPVASIGRVLGSLFYTITSLVFINLLYSRVTMIAGYDKEEMMVFYLVGQMALFTIGQFSYENIRDLIHLVNTGGLDLILAKPIPALFYVSTRNISIFTILNDELLSFILLVSIINWERIDITILSVMAGVVVFIGGLVAMHVFQFLCALPVFWIGESSSLLDATWAFEYNVGRVIPFEGFNPSLKMFFTTLIPALITTGLTSSVILGKSNPLVSVIWVLLVASIALIIKNYFWKKAIKNYTSASS